MTEFEQSVLKGLENRQTMLAQILAEHLAENRGSISNSRLI